MTIKCIGFKRQDGLDKICPVKFNCQEHKSATKGDIMLQPVNDVHEGGCIKFKRIHTDVKGFNQKVH